MKNWKITFYSDLTFTFFFFLLWPVAPIHSKQVSGFLSHSFDLQIDKVYFWHFVTRSLRKWKKKIQIKWSAVKFGYIFKGSLLTRSHLGRMICGAADFFSLLLSFRHHFELVHIIRQTQMEINPNFPERNAV